MQVKLQSRQQDLRSLKGEPRWKQHRGEQLLLLPDYFAAVDQARLL